MENNEKVANLLGKEVSSGNRETNYAKKETLNPNAREFVPLGVRSRAADILLPDDLTLDFEATGLDNTSQEINGLSFSSLSLMDGKEHSALEQQDISSDLFNGNNYVEKQRIVGSSRGERRAPLGFRGSFDKCWDERIGNDGRLLAKDRYSYYGNSRVDFCTDVSNEQLMMENEDLNPIVFLASRFPGFSAESLMEVYFANGGDLNPTIEMLTQLEVYFANGGDLNLTIEMLTQLEAEMNRGCNQILNSKNLPTTNLSGSDFPALCLTNVRNGLGKDCTLFFSPFPSAQSRRAIDLGSAVEKMASQDSSIWAYEKKGSSATSVGSSRSLQLLGSSYNSGQGRGICSNAVQNRANMYSEMWEEARDHARIRNAYFEKARQAYQIVNKSLAKDLIIKGQMHNMWMKAAHEKAQESIFRQSRTGVIVYICMGTASQLLGLGCVVTLWAMKGQEVSVCEEITAIAVAVTQFCNLLVVICDGTPPFKCLFKGCDKEIGPNSMSHNWSTTDDHKKIAKLGHCCSYCGNLFADRDLLTFDGPECDHAPKS
ncbi:small MutS related domain-containing family protein [Striga asiatica]|uniref:Small MutS related domain-containing family protein n=1 Tax=Striga asiatica TaxID=4170 RepID=A0A5A7PRC6_STRAF|nr:small MutS related domain-containing family protein [Striga asiatica]